MVKTGDGSDRGEKLVKPTEVKTPESIEKISARAATIKSREYPTFPSSYSGGVMPMSIRSRFVDERQRLTEDFTQKWRSWRAQWIKDQTLHPAEPVYVKELEREFYNPIRRAYRAPWNWIESQLAPVVGVRNANKIRRVATLSLMFYGVSFWIYYIAKYHRRSWEDGPKTAWPIVIAAREAVYPGDPAYPNVGVKFSKQEFADLGFSSRKVLLFNESEAN